MDFLKLPSYHRPDHQKTIMTYLKWHPNLKDAVMVGTEKLDGCNVQWGFVPGSGLVRVGSRTAWKGEINFNTMENTIPDQALFGIGPVMNEYIEKLVKIDKLLYEEFKTAKEIRIYNEMVGPGINGRINYGPNKYIKSYSMFIDGEKVTPKLFNEFMLKANCEDLLIDSTFTFNDLTEVMQFDVDLFEEKTSKKWEGLVIEPYDLICEIPTKGPFVIKKKTKWMIDKEAGKNKIKTPKQPLSPKALKLMEEFQSYITENRLIDLFSKEGSITKPQEIGKYIGLMQKDAYEDFLKDNPDFDPDTLDVKVKKQIFNVGKQIRDMLMVHL